MHILQYLLLSAVVCGHLEQYNYRVKRLIVDNFDSRSSDVRTTKVLIIGSGIAGLEAARLLQQNGVETIVLEARNRTGGRVWSIRSKNNLMLDMGARYIHGQYGSIPSGLLTNPIWDLTRSANISICFGEPHDFLGTYPLYYSNILVQKWYDEYMLFVREETRISSSNISFADYVNLFAQKKHFNEKQRSTLYNFAYFTIADREGTELESISAKGYLDRSSVFYGEEPVICDTGFMAITDYLAKNLTNIRFGEIVTKIDYNKNLVKVSTKNGQIYQAEFVLITVPLGVLKSKQIEFNPQLPQWKLDAIDRIGFGYYEKIYLLWDQVWWNTADYYFFQSASKSINLRYWITANKWNGKPFITCLFAGKAVSSLTWKQNKNETVKDILDTLQKMFPNIKITPPTEIYMSNWNEDPFSYGSYSYISVNQKYEDPFRLSETINNRLLFAGEATNTDTYGYTHGALLSARREVTRLLNIGLMGNGYQIPNTMIEHLVTIGLFIVFYMALYQLWSNSISMPSNEDYINMLTNEIEEENCDQFVSGFWLSRYYQYDRFYRPHQFSLSFDSQTRQVNGNGVDDIGKFVVNGIYSINTNRLAIVKTYREETENSTENFGHNITIQVAWNSNQYHFEGKWFIKTRNYSGDGRIELKFEKSFRAMA
ncbi:unnamed protein product [Adineta steineri]|uniref:Amine oxidase n=1 Tax=Adineta steineri TaxID=433720 RepID=A0A814NTH5_9BILA|nr:unnamed protein product [Adineta steineri]CAF3987846.1 unnamed protein product [Adineta steineri]